MTKENVHEGHRERLKEKFISSPESLNQHELIELLLFYSIPRVDTNVTAHKLCSTFGRIENMFSQDVEQLTCVDGVGKNSAVLLKIVGELLSRIKKSELEDKEFYKFIDYEKEIGKYFVGFKTVEKCIAVFFDKNHKWIAQTEYNCNKEHEVDIDVTEFASAIGTYKPKYVVLAHNHTSGNFMPSANDDMATERINLVCSIYGVKLLDHIIFAGGNSYSYFQDDRLGDKFSEKEIYDIIKSVKE